MSGTRFVVSEVGRTETVRDKTRGSYVVCLVLETEILEGKKDFIFVFILGCRNNSVLNI